ncbi:glycoside hydrolase family 2 protein [Paenibacillus sp. Root444D2]|uniref:glycoside hydrolase family 2 protein n=1 Tax=Paenibacillus sp. Root444D2 TaxID=1736538 RepID=UPI00070CC9E8|nr:glycoside hydrolase family 2 TIM barrel-domain containing protein [Paenibacillus sp. Root444D2]KQX48610.1 beta-glucuronidase [Paenibacillus sp. Root444D2]
MLRLFPTNQIRQVQELEGDWDFQPIEQNEGIPKDYHYRLPVPGCWEMHPELLTYRGKGVYRKIITLHETTSVRLLFKGVSHTAVIYFDGEEVGFHYNAYTPFTTKVITDAAPGSHEIVVVVDNSFTKESKLHFANDYYTYGGIIRPVGIECISDVYINRIQFTPSWKDGQWHGEASVYVTNASRNPTEVELKGTLGEFALQWKKQIIASGETSVFRVSSAFPNVKIWSNKTPNMYLVNVQLFRDGNKKPSDDLIERVGFREVTTFNGKIQVNGEDIILKGFNRHEDHPMVGAAFPYQLMVQDMELMLEAGSNAVRTSHYPNDERFLDLCDERGVFVWEENHARGFQLDHMLDPQCQEQCMVCNQEMVENHFNHPSIIMWGILNECASNTIEGKALYRQQLEQIRGMDRSRPLTYATHHREQELCFDLADIVSFNLYPGWYTNEDPGELSDQARKWADELGGLGKPMIMSEFGGDGYYGLRDPNKVRGTEERQAEIIEQNLAAYTSKPYISGMFIWQFCDCKVVEDTGWLLSRAGTQNSKGIVDRYRRPKLAFEIVKKYFRE